MYSFRQKIFISYVVVFLLFLALMFPFASRTVNEIVRKNMSDRADEIIVKLQSAANNDAIIRRMKEEKSSLFFRVSIFTNERKIIYDTHMKRLVGPRFSQEEVVELPEINNAFRNGVAFGEDYSDLLGQRFVYFAKAFDFHGKTYVIRTAFPDNYVNELTTDFIFGFLGLSVAILLLFTAMTWFIIYHLTNPIQEIINAVKPYQEGERTTIPEIRLASRNKGDEFTKLADTLNSLSARIQDHIDAITSERNEKRAVLESLVEGVIAVDTNNIVTYANHTALKFLEMGWDDLVGKEVIVARQSKIYDLLEKCQEEGAPLSDTLTIKINGEKLFLDVIAAPKMANTGAVLVMEDKTIHHRIHEMRKDFIANASHELKTPITIIRGFAETLHDNPTMPQDTMALVTGKIVNNCNRMTKLIRDLLTLADIEQLPESRILPCDLVDIVNNCAMVVRDAYTDAQVTVVYDENEEYSLLGDGELLEMAMTNLMTNAAKYSKPPADVTVAVKKLDKAYEIRVSDKGIGIPKEDLPYIFHRFYTVDKAHSRKMGGSGLGLSLVETIIEKHFGKITVDSEVGKGTTFTITLPVRTHH
ncbi:MAG: PAS domain-containing protein [Chlamydiales bacterium]|nr:PAS domain-containing protein [Chlamydiia bacterium]MCP5507945.1 PAS domain-containing protein [Chlamydiales bacterium]